MGVEPTRLPWQEYEQEHVGIIRRDRDLVPRMMFAGRPSPEDVRKTYEDDVDPVSQARLKARKKAPKKRRTEMRPQ